MRNNTRDNQNINTNTSNRDNVNFHQSPRSVKFDGFARRDHSFLNDAIKHQLHDPAADCSTEEKNLNDQVPILKYEDNLTLCSSTWRIRDNRLPKVPLYHPLEKSHLVIHGEEPSVIATRIADCLRKLSIAAIFDDSNALAYAETANHVKFIIRLFKEANKKNPLYDNAIVIEIQRKQGCSVSFHNSCRAIFEAAEGYEPERQGNDVTKPCKKLKIPEQFEKELESEDVKSVIQIVDDLLKNDYLDSNLLGMENLRMLTDDSLTNHKVSVLAAKIVLIGSCKYNSIKDTVISLLRNSNDINDDCDIFRDEFEDDHFRTMHNHALAVVAKSLHLLNTEGELSQILEDETWLSNEFVSLLIGELNDSKERPHDAHLSAMCLNILIRTSSTACSNAMELDAPVVTKYSRYIGQRNHLLLACESENIMEALNF